MREFVDAIQSAGLNPPSNIEPGKIHRFPGLDKRDSNRAGYCLLFPDMLGGIYGDYSTGMKGHWEAKWCKTFTPYEREKFNQLVKAKQAEEEEQRESGYKLAAERAVKIINAAENAQDNHPYLIAKGVKSHGLKIYKENLLIPLSHAGVITTYQTIAPDGSKKLMADGRKKGSAFYIPGDERRIFVVEGYATGASVHESTGHAVIVAIDAGNMIHVVDTLIANGRNNIIIAADNDHGKEPNTGIENAKAICAKHPQIEFVTPPAINDKPTDWNDYVKAHGVDAARRLLLSEPEIITASNIKKGDMSIHIPDDLLHGSELLKLGMQAARDLASINIYQLLFPTVLTHIATAIAGKIRIGNNHPSFFCVKVAPTSIGKTATDKNLTVYIRPFFNQSINRNNGSPPEIINSFYGPTNFASGPALRRAIKNKPRSLIIVDEISNLFSGRDERGIDANKQEKINAILELSTSSGTESEVAYSKEADNIDIKNHCLNLTGNATPSIFNDIKHYDLESGFINRLDFYMYAGRLPYHDEPIDDSEAAAMFAERLAALRHAEKPQGRYDLLTDDAVNIGYETAAKNSMHKFSRLSTDMKNAEQNDGRRGIIGRIYESALKFALIYHADKPGNLYDPLTLEDVERGQRMATLLVDWKLAHLTQNVSSGEFDTICVKFKNGIEAAIRHGKPPTWAVVRNAAPALKDLDHKKRDAAAKMMIEAGEIKIVNDGKKTYYYLIKQ